MNKDEAKAMIEALGVMASGARCWGGGEYLSDDARLARLDSINETEAALKTMLQNAALTGGPSADERVRVRIPVLVNADGEWHASGTHFQDDRARLDSVFEYVENGRHVVRWLEADITLPKVETVEGTVVP